MNNQKNNKSENQWKKEKSKSNLRDYSFDTVSGMKVDELYYPNKIDENYGQDSIYSLDSSKLRNELNWCDKISLEEGIIETINWINDNWITISKLPHDYIHKI